MSESNTAREPAPPPPVVAKGPEAVHGSHEEFIANGLLLRIAGEDEQALRELYDLWAAVLLGIALRLLRDRTMAEEAVQDAFVRMWRQAAAYDPGQGRPFVWAYTILRSICLDRLRKNGRKKRGNGLVPEAVSGSEADEAAQSEIICREVTEQIMRGMAGLSEAERRCLELYVFHEYTQQEIASEIRSPLGTIKTRVRRALSRLRKSIERHE